VMGLMEDELGGTRRCRRTPRLTTYFTQRIEFRGTADGDGAAMV
jgi:hypothetical protein